MEDLVNAFESIFELLVTIGEGIAQLIEFLGQGFVAIQTFLSLPGQASAVVNSLAVFMPGIIWGPVLGLISIMLVLRVWKIITSGD